jgi:uncharacterized protein YxjI
MANLYALHQTLFSLGGDAWIEDEHGNRLFEVDGKAFALGRTLDLLDPSGTVLFTVHAPMVSLRPTFEISRDDETVATIRRALFTLLGSRLLDRAGRRQRARGHGRLPGPRVPGAPQ